MVTLRRSTTSLAFGLVDTVAAMCNSVTRLWMQIFRQRLSRCKRQGWKHTELFTLHPMLARRPCVRLHFKSDERSHDDKIVLPSPGRKESQPTVKARPRANTTTFSSPFPWLRPHREQPAPLVISQTPNLSIEGLIQALSPPSVPSLAHARALASTVSNCSPLPSREVLNPVLASLCHIDQPSSVQTAGYDILSAYCENHESLALETAGRLSYFSLFRGSSTTWAVDLWEPRFKALRSLTRYGIDIIGIEESLISVLQSWIEGAFVGLMKSPPSSDRSEQAERERSVDVLTKFLTEIFTKSENISRIPNRKMVDILTFYSSLVDRCITSNINKESTPLLSVVSPNVAPGKQHRRNLSSLSSSSIPSMVSDSPPLGPTFKQPAEIATTLYLNHLSAHLKMLSASNLQFIIPFLFRSLAFCYSPLPRLSVAVQSRKKNTLEERITDTLNSLFIGPFAATCMLILKKFLFPPSKQNSLDEKNLIGQTSLTRTVVMTSLGAHRTLRNHVRRALSARLARAYISRETSIGYSHSGAPGHMELEVDLMEKAWPKDDYSPSSGTSGNGWDAGRLGRVLAESIGAWIDYHSDNQIKSEMEKPMLLESEQKGKDEILEEAAGVLKDLLQELDVRDDEHGVMDDDEVVVVKLALLKLSDYVLPLKNPDGSPYILPIVHPNEGATPLLRTISSLLARGHSKTLNPFLSKVLMNVAEHLTDMDTARLPLLMFEQHGLSPTSPEWLDNWETLLSNEMLSSPHRLQTRKAIMEKLKMVYDGVKDMKAYRAPLGDLIWKFCCGCAKNQCDDADAMWKILGEETVLRSSEQNEGDIDGAMTTDQFIYLLHSVASETRDEEEDSIDSSSIYTNDTPSYSPSAPTTASASVSPTISRVNTDFNVKDRDPNMPSVMSILSSLTTGGSSSRSQSVQPHHREESRSPLSFGSTTPRDISAVSALIEMFSQLTFTPFALESKNLNLALRIYHVLIDILSDGKSNKARLTALQFLVRIRADRDHRLYFVSVGYDPQGLVASLAALVGRTEVGLKSEVNLEDIVSEGLDRKTRPRFPQERDGRQLLRGRGTGGPSRSAPSRSRSRTAHAVPIVKYPDPLWHIPESLPFVVSGSDWPGEVLVSYDSEGLGRIMVLPISRYLQAIVAILEKETSWEILAYVLCHIPVQLSNKHLFCGPNSRIIISKLLSILCTGILNGDFGASVEQWPPGLKIRDAHGLAYQTLSVLVSYQRCFDLQQRHLLVEVFQAGLNSNLATIKCCLHALSLSAFELQASMTKCLSRILEMLSQIMSNPNMAVHILGFLSIIGSLPSLHANFTESDFKMVFGVALQYLQHYNSLNASPTMSWALSQHVRILSYSVVYIWFLAVKLPDRPKHVAYITRQLLLANEGKEMIDGPTEVCFDWLARYTYASADPRPANSIFSDIVLHPSEAKSGLPDKEKTWLMGNSVVTVRALASSGWVEVLSRRPSGYSRFICRVENVPMVGPGDVAPDLLSLPAGLIMERHATRPVAEADLEENKKEKPISLAVEPHGEDLSVPDPLTGYVWSQTAPSQRRKQVAIDPSFLVLQLSPFPDGVTQPYVKRVMNTSSLSKFVSLLDRIPVIDTHKVGILYVAPGQRNEMEILRNVHGSPAYTRFLEGIGRLINLRGQVDVYAGGLDPDEDGKYAYAWWDDIGQILYHTATMMPTNDNDLQCNNKKRHIGNDYVRIIWNDSGLSYDFDTLKTQFQFVNIVIEPHSLGSIAAFSNNLHENEYFKVTIQLAPGMTEFAPIGHFKVISAENLPLLVRQLSLLADWFASVFSETQRDTVRVETKTNWHARLEAIRRFKNQIPQDDILANSIDGVMGQETLRDFTTSY